MNFLITGGSGFIGTNFIDYIMQNNYAELVSNVDKCTDVSNTFIDRKYMSSSSYNGFHSDICDIGMKDDVIGDQYHVCVHFAAESHVDRSLEDTAPFIKTNIQGTLAVAQYCAKHKIKMIHISTDEVYGHHEDLSAPKFTVKSRLAPRNPYAASKASAELMLQAFALTVPDFNYQIVRPSNNYGPHQDLTKFVPKMINSIYHRKAFPMYGNGDFYREWTHVTDTCRALMEIINGGYISGTIHNVSSNCMCSNFDLYMKTLDLIRTFEPDAVGNIEFIKDPRGNAHDKIYSITNSVCIDYTTLFDGMKELIENFFDEPESKG